MILLRYSKKKTDQLGNLIICRVTFGQPDFKAFEAKPLIISPLSSDSLGMSSKGCTCANTLQSRALKLKQLQCRSTYDTY